MPTVQLSPFASGILVIAFIFMMLVFAVVLAAIAYVLLKLNAVLEAYQVKIAPLFEKTQGVLDIAGTKLNRIGDKTEAILSQGEVTAEVVHEKVEKTATMVQRTVNAPLIGINAFTAGFQRAVRTFGSLQREQAERNEGAKSAGDLTAVSLIVPSSLRNQEEFAMSSNSDRVEINV